MQMKTTGKATAAAHARTVTVTNATRDSTRQRATRSTAGTPSSLDEPPLASTTHRHTPHTGRTVPRPRAQALHPAITALPAQTS